jgi:translation initiation factor 3 subunit C
VSLRLNKKMSRFFKANAGFDSDSSSTSSEEDYIESSDSGDHLSEEEENEDNVVKVASGAARFMKGAASSDDESSDEDVKRMVKSTRDKRFEDMRAIAKGISNGQKNGDWVMIQNEFDKIVKALNKAASIIAREKVPRFVIRCLVQLDDHIKNFVTNKEQIKKLNPSSAKSFNAMKQKVRKIEKTYEKEMKAFRAVSFGFFRK